MTAAILDRPLSSQQAARPAGKVVFVVEEPELNASVTEAVTSLIREGYHVTFLVGKRGPLTVWLSKQHVYYFIFDVRMPDLYHSPWLRFKKVLTQTLELMNMFSQASVGRVVIVGPSMTAGQARMAADLAGVPGCIEFDTNSGGASLYEKLSAQAGISGKAKDITPISRLVASLFAIWTCRHGLLRHAYMPVKSAADVVAGVLLSVLSFPIWAAMVSRRKATGLAPYEQLHILGKENQTTVINSFASAEAFATGTQGKLWWLASLTDVIDGRLSFVGPRVLTTDVAWISMQEGLHLHVVPGITGWSQIKRGDGITEAQRIAMDQGYMLSVNPMLDLKIVAATLLKAIKP